MEPSGSVVECLTNTDCIITPFATRKISTFKLVSVAKQTGLNLSLLESPKTRFLTSWPTVIIHRHGSRVLSEADQL